MHRAGFLLALSLLALAGGATSGPRLLSLEPPNAADLRLARAPVDAAVASTARDVSAVKPARVWSARYTTPSGEVVNLSVSARYAQSPELGQRWANFLGSLLHGPELATVAVYMVAPDEIGGLCGQAARACYYPATARLISPAVDQPDLSAEAALAHEYAHHVAANRNNAPWPAIAWGTKRWASQENVCRDARNEDVFPGAQDALRYRFNPGEGFAEAYRLLNERRLGRAESAWEIVDRIFYPGAAALARLEEDVVQPWTASTSATYTGSFAGRARTSRRHTVATPYDGDLRLAVRTARSARLRVEAFDPRGARLANRVATAGRQTTLTTTVCGSRSLRIRVTRLSGRGAYTLSVSRP